MREVASKPGLMLCNNSILVSAVIAAQVRIQIAALDSRLRGNDGAP